MYFRNKMKKYAVLAIATTCLSSMASTTLASGNAGPGRHYLMVLLHSKVSSMRAHFADNRGYWHSRCIDTDRRSGWKFTDMRVFNGSPVYVQTFSQPTCIGHISTSEGETVPGENGLTNFWYTKAAR